MARGFDAACEGQGAFARYGYLFRGPWYFRYDWVLVQQDHEWKPIGLWKGFDTIFPAGVDAALGGAGAHVGKTFFIKGATVAVYDWGSLSIERTTTLAEEFGLPAPFDSGVATALAGREKRIGYGYFFKGSEYVAYDWSTGRVANRAGLDAWKLPASFLAGIDATFNGAETRAQHAFFFVEDEYVRYDWKTEELSPARVRPITDMRMVKPSSGPVVPDIQPTGGGTPEPIPEAMWLACETLEAIVTAIPGVLGIDVGARTVGVLGDPVIRVYVDADAVLPEQIPEVFSGAPVVVRRGKLELTAGDEKEYRPLVGGCMVLNPRNISNGPSGIEIRPGTLGAIVRHDVPGAANVLGLSCYHVLGKRGESVEGDEIYQPSMTSDKIGTLEGWVDSQGSAEAARVDAAVCSIVVPARNAIIEIGVPKGIADPVEWGRVQKRGAVTGHTWGLIDGMYMPRGATADKDLRGQFTITPDVARSPEWSRRGDSGSVVLDSNGRVVGLHRGSFTHDNGVRVGLATPIRTVVAALAAAGVDISFDWPVPEIREFEPEKGQPGGGVTIRGSGFLLTSRVVFRDTATEFKVLDDTCIDAVIPGGPPGPATIFVTAEGGEGKSRTPFEIVH